MRLERGRLQGRKAKGFTFVELMATLAIVATLAMISVPLLQINAQREKERQLLRALVDIREAIDAYKRAADQGRVPRNENGYPASLKVLAVGIPDQTHAERKLLYFLRRIPRDPFFDDANVPADEMWFKRAYDSPPDMPAEGDDVFDVASKSSMSGLNGIPLNQW